MDKTKVVILLTILQIFSVSFVQADVPHLITYQGRLTDSLGTPLDTTVDMTFTMYDDSIGTLAIWTETQPNVTVQNGLFSVLLGSVTPVPNTVFNGSVRWLGMQVDGGSVSTSRLPMVSMAYAYRAGFADTASYALSAPGGSNNGWVDDGNRVRLETETDNVGIGIAVPSAKLDVNGDVIFREKITVGTSHTNTGDFSSIGGGAFNTVSGNWAVIGGGNGNSATQTYTTVSGGAANKAIGTGATISGGTDNTADGLMATVGGGKFNRASGAYSVIAGGGGLTSSDSNRVDGDHGVIVGGQGNTVAGDYSAIASGYAHSILSDYSAILGGFADTITNTAAYSYLFGIGSKLTEDSTFMVDMPHVRFGDESTGYEFPTQDGSSGQVMATDGSGQLGWTDVSGISQSVADSLYVNVSGDEMNGKLIFDNNNDGSVEARVDLSSDFANLELYDGDSLTSKIYGSYYGGMYLYSDTGGIRVIADANPRGGFIKLYDNNAIPTIQLDAGTNIANNTVQLPDSAIDNEEILNEPGIVSVINLSGNSLPDGSMIDLTVLSITIPTAGYIHVMGRCYVKLSDTRQENGAYIQIDETSGGSTITGRYVRVSQDTALYLGAYRFPVFVDGIYYKSLAGTYTFRLEGQHYTTNGTATTYNQRLTAVFYPTSYGTVSTLATNPGENTEAVPVAINAEEDAPGTEQTYQVDLRYYELKAKEARMKALQAELELERARERQTRR